MALALSRGFTQAPRSVARLTMVRDYFCKDEAAWFCIFPNHHVHVANTSHAYSMCLLSPIGKLRFPSSRSFVGRLFCCTFFLSYWHFDLGWVVCLHNIVLYEIDIALGSVCWRKSFRSCRTAYDLRFGTTSLSFTLKAWFRETYCRLLINMWRRRLLTFFSEFKRNGLAHGVSSATSGIYATMNLGKCRSDHGPANMTPQ